MIQLYFISMTVSYWTHFSKFELKGNTGSRNLSEGGPSDSRNLWSMVVAIFFWLVLTGAGGPGGPGPPLDHFMVQSLISTSLIDRSQEKNSPSNPSAIERLNISKLVDFLCKQSNLTTDVIVRAFVKKHIKNVLLKHSALLQEIFQFSWKMFVFLTHCAVLNLKSYLLVAH